MEIVLLCKYKKLDANKRIFKLNPYVDPHGLLRGGGGIQNPLIQQEIQHQVLLTNDLTITSQLVS